MVAGSEETQPWRAMEACGEENDGRQPTSVRSCGQAQLGRVHSSEET